ncbi:LutC/YkgG family protein [Streptomyces telluris]|uniref:LUD domain-containing protein n=1 Tax=Streptomyces telluris TaxID=2720021 RepID=A0A9X2LEY6_9ACTN|nr:LUD domain-containing protein [Streptomyces telluris]MCQ8769704.1 LUD domain-containing protein [Streptomyces telluris]NJP76140.1 LUD domain-containing protein [Streptomyces telluris]
MSSGPSRASGRESGRERILGRVRRALADVPASEQPGHHPVTRDYAAQHGERTHAATIDLLAENLADYRARVHRTEAAGLPALLARLLSERGASQVVVPPSLPDGWLASAPVRLVRDSPALTTRELDSIDSVVTGCALAVAETGTVVLDAGPDQGSRRITLVPDHHLCVVRTDDQVVSSVPQALRRLAPARPLTWISGPSATSDIELERVEGVHGPRTLEVILVAGDPREP